MWRQQLYILSVCCLLWTQSVPAYWAPFRKLLIDRIGDAEGNDDINIK